LGAADGATGLGAAVGTGALAGTGDGVTGRLSVSNRCKMLCFGSSVYKGSSG